MDGNPFEIRDETHRFFEQIQERLSAVADVERPIFRFMLRFSLLETLAKARYPDPWPDSQNPGKRFYQLILDHSDGTYSNRAGEWRVDKNRISLPQLSFRLDGLFENRSQWPKKVSRREAEELRKEVRRTLKTWPDGRILRPFEADPLPEDLEIPGTCRRMVEEAQYIWLLWKMRCHVIHEGRLPGKQVDISNDGSTPYYLGTLGRSACPWDLVFPEEFIHNVASACLDSVKEHFLVEGRSPYDSFGFGPNWLSED